MRTVDAVSDVDVGWFGRDDVEAVLGAAAGECGVAGFLEERAGCEDEGAVARHALGFVDGGGVGVGEVTGVEVAGREG